VGQFLEAFCRQFIYLSGRDELFNKGARLHVGKYTQTEFAVCMSITRLSQFAAGQENIKAAPLDATAVPTKNYPTHAMQCQSEYVCMLCTYTYMYLPPTQVAASKQL
jgi:hypothetical protein